MNSNGFLLESKSEYKCITDKTIPNEVEYRTNEEICNKPRRQKNGNFVENYPNGKLKSSSEWINGKENGLFVEYYQNGQLEVERNWKNGKKDGPAAAYFLDGQVKESVLHKWTKGWFFCCIL